MDSLKSLQFLGCVAASATLVTSLCAQSAQDTTSVDALPADIRELSSVRPWQTNDGIIHHHHVGESMCGLDEMGSSDQHREFMFLLYRGRRTRGDEKAADRQEDGQEERLSSSHHQPP